MPWDADIDIGTYEFEKALSLKEEFEKKELKVNYTKKTKYRKNTLKIKDKKHPEYTKFHIDIYDFEKIEKPIFRDMHYSNCFARTLSRLNVIIKSDIPMIYDKKGLLSIDARKTFNKISREMIPEKIRNLLSKLLDEPRYLFSKKYIIEFKPFKTLKIDFYNTTVKIPENYEEHLRIIYGSNWRTPDHTFTTTSGRYFPYSKRINGIYVTKVGE